MSNIETSLINLEKTDFGDCIDCKEEIGFNRLIASPGAQRCINCQNRYEKISCTWIRTNLIASREYPLFNLYKSTLPEKPERRLEQFYC